MTSPYSLADYPEHMRAYRAYWSAINRRFSEVYVRRERPRVSDAIDALMDAEVVTLAMAQLHNSIRNSPMNKFWPVIRQTKGTLLINYSGESHCPSPWKRTKSGNLRYRLPGHLIFSPWPKNFDRRLRNWKIRLNRIAMAASALENESNIRATYLPNRIFNDLRSVRWLISEIREAQSLVGQESTFALEMWSANRKSASDVTLRISQDLLIYDDGKDRCEIQIPAPFAKHLSMPSLPEVSPALHWVGAGNTTYRP